MDKHLPLDESCRRAYSEPILAHGLNGEYSLCITARQAIRCGLSSLHIMADFKRF